MKILVLVMLLLFPSSTLADTQTDSQPATPAEQAKDDKPAVSTASQAKSAGEKEEKKDVPGEYSCEYYTVTLPSGWKAIRVPEERQGLVNAIFAKNSGSPVISMVVGPRKGAEPDLIASMFADQFKASKAPVLKNGQYYFTFPQNDPASQKPLTATAWVGVEGEKFMLTTWTGNQKEIQNFLKNNIKGNGDYAKMLPQ